MMKLFFFMGNSAWFFHGKFKNQLMIFKQLTFRINVKYVKKIVADLKKSNNTFVLCMKIEEISNALSVLRIFLLRVI